MDDMNKVMQSLKRVVSQDRWIFKVRSITGDYTLHTYTPSSSGQVDLARALLQNCYMRGLSVCVQVNPTNILSHLFVYVNDLDILQEEPSSFPICSSYMATGSGYIGLWELAEDFPLNSKEDLDIAKSRFRGLVEYYGGALDECTYDGFVPVPFMPNCDLPKMPLVRLEANGDEKISLGVFPKSCVWNCSYENPIPTILTDYVPNKNDNLKQILGVTSYNNNRSLIMDGVIGDSSVTRQMLDIPYDDPLIVCAYRLACCFTPDPVILKILTNPKWKISKHITDNCHWSVVHIYASRILQFVKTYTHIGEIKKTETGERMDMNWFNANHIFIDVDDIAIKNIKGYAYHNRAFFTRRGVYSPVAYSHMTKSHALLPSYIRDRTIKRYKSIQFAPCKILSKDRYNLWTGWGVQAKEGDCTLITQFLQEHICGYDEKANNYILNWLAHMIQKPYEPMRKGVFLQKTNSISSQLLYSIIAKLCPKHSIVDKSLVSVIAEHKHDLHNCLFFGVSTACRYKPRIMGFIRTLLSSRVVDYRYFGSNKWSGDNLIRILACSSKIKSARYISYNRDLFYFITNSRYYLHGETRELLQEIVDGRNPEALEAFMHLLKTRDIRGFDPSKIQDKSLDRAGELTDDPHQFRKWWRTRLRYKTLLKEPWKTNYAYKQRSLFFSYCQWWMRNSGKPYQDKGIESDMAKFFSKNALSSIVSKDKDHCVYISFPHPYVCKQEFEDAIKHQSKEHTGAYMNEDPESIKRWLE